MSGSEESRSDPPDSRNVFEDQRHVRDKAISPSTTFDHLRPPLTTLTTLTTSTMSHISEGRLTKTHTTWGKITHARGDARRSRNKTAWDL